MHFLHPFKRKFIRKAALLLLLSSRLYSQSLLDQYVEEGLKNNQIIQQRNISLEQSENALRIARSFFLPSVQVLGDYTSGKGGRSISIPIGDLLNPVYSSLNQLTQSDAFPQVSNVNQNFFPHNFYDARVRTSVPIINSDLYINQSIRAKEVVLKENELLLYKRQLVLEIQQAYFNYLSAVEAVKIYQSALKLVSKNVEINESLVRNGKGLPANVLRSKSEMEKVKADLNSAQNNVINARRYFNFLLNKDLDTNINEDTTFTSQVQVTDSSTNNVTQREELAILRTAAEISQASVKLNQLSRLPKVNAFLDLGTQASNWEYNSKSQYYLFGVQLSLPVFQGFRNSINIKQSKLEVQRSTIALENTSQQLKLAAAIADNNLKNAKENYRAANEQLTSAQSYFNLIDKGYLQGVNTLIEFLDARNQLTTSQLQYNVRGFEMLIAQAKLQRETASYTFNN
jgi:outer membrane protein